MQLVVLTTPRRPLSLSRGPMAQRDKKVEEPMELHAPELTLCANSCGFSGNPATKNLCQNCFLAASDSPPSPSSSSMSPSPAVCDKLRPAAAAPPALWRPFAPAADRPPAGPAESLSKAPRTSSSVNRCHSCRKRVGLTSFRCRCGRGSPATARRVAATAGAGAASQRAN
ncbi:zinc finger A20 and AN1 domain-containing stress-associated protein 11-like [Panicum virgatum]|uniref:zinc finger A20 and AN1 domain-containing stress-associated protein 11-like n=1 Tax=Panicum virgatum TaxID=38727 RepID=UPI0019D6026E|nr:zinc finger A20 and AN1 domain-containing stress-associated protein 11-like [Panicum virgatum]